MVILTREFLKETIYYNPLDGSFTWLYRELGEHFKNQRSVAVFNSRFAGLGAGSITKNKKSATNYLTIKICGKSYKAHRLAFLIMEGWLPEEVDHLDHNGVNNKWINLRASTSFDNSKNLPIQKSNKTGVIGVNWHKTAKKWQARAVNHEGERIDLGRFDNFDDAVNARKKHEIEFGYYENRGAL